MVFSQWDVSECSVKKFSLKFEYFKTFCIFVVSVKDIKTSLGTSEYTGGEDVRLLTLLSSERTSVKPEVTEGNPAPKVGAHQSSADG